MESEETRSNPENIPCKSCSAAAAAPTEDAENKAQTAAFILGAALFLAGMLLPIPSTAKIAVFLASYALLGGKIVWKAIRHILAGQIFDENFLMSVATIGAFCIGEFGEGVAVMLFYRIGEFFEDRAVDRSKKSIASLMNIRPDSANLKCGNEIKKVSPEDVKPDDLILVQPGEKVPLDGIVVEGTSFADTSALTGESVPRAVKPGNEILSGSINKSGVLTVKVTKVFGESTVSKILDLVQNAASKKAPTENFITKFAKIYTPAVVFAALALAIIPPLTVPGASFPVWISRALTFLVVSCPCALVISIPLSFFGGIGSASRQGILIKGGNYLEALNHVGTVVFDKTGTLTKGTFHVTKINTEPGWDGKSLLDFAAHAEQYSSHPIAVSIREAYGKEPDASRTADCEEIPGKGVCIQVDGKNVLAGSYSLMADEKIACSQITASGTIVYLAVGGKLAGSIQISDEIKADSANTIRELNTLGVHTAMLTGDSASAGKSTADTLGIGTVYANLLPQQKVEKMETLREEMPDRKKLLFVGDGVNDAPVLASADVGIAMGGLGSDAAIEAADIVLMTDEPSKLIQAIKTAQRTHLIVMQNIVFALAVKAAILVLAAFGMATMWEAVFGDVGVTLIAILNTLRIANH